MSILSLGVDGDAGRCPSLPVILLCLAVASGQYYRPEEQLPGQRYGQDGRYYYSTSPTYVPGRQYPPGQQQQQPGLAQPGQNFDSYGRPIGGAGGYGSQGAYYPDALANPYAPVNPSFPVRSRGSCIAPTHLPQLVTVRTKLGEVVGKYEYLCDGPERLYSQRPLPGVMQPLITGNVSAFLGIPYAEAPLRERRFRPPESRRPWHRIEAYSYRPACPQPPGLKDNNGQPVPMDEDCLYLNIFAPTVQPLNEPYPVMIYIHGGDFDSGTAAYFPGHMLASSMNVIVVTLNYRLGALGFFSTGDSESPGNYGVLDQSMAIRWVYDNIQSFMGNPRKITLFGPDAGAASAGLHMFSPRSRDMFQNVIAQSGAAVADWGIITNLERARNTSRVFAEKVGCDATSSRRLVTCLRNRSPKELTEFNFKPQLGFFPWAPIVDKNITMLEQHRFMPETPEEIIRRGQFDRSKLYVTGVTKDEGAYVILKDLSLSVVNYHVNYLYFSQKIREYIKMYNYSLNTEGAYNAILYAYSNWADPKNETLIREGYVNMLSDAIYKAPVDEMVKLLLDQGVRTYMYVLNSSVESLRRPLWQAVPHNSEWHYVTGAPFMDDRHFPLLEPQSRANTWTEEDRKMSELYMRMWSNVARYRNPTHSNVPYVRWEYMERNNLQYLNLNTTMYSSTLRNYRQTEAAFWNVYLPTLLGPAPPTYPPYMRPWWQYEQPLQIGFWSAITVSILFFVLFVMVGCMYCRVAGHNKTQDIDFAGDESLQAEEYSLTHPITSEISKKEFKDEKALQADAQHTSV